MLRKLKERMPSERLVYVADTAFHPYGPRPLAEVRSRVAEMLQFLERVPTGGQRGIKLAILACHTAAIAWFCQGGGDAPSFSFPVVGTLKATVRAALKATRNGRIGLIATEATVRSGVYERVFGQANSSVVLFSRPAQALVALIESGLSSRDPEAARDLVRETVAPFKALGVDTLVLACSHFPFLEGVFAEELGMGTRVVDPAWEAALQVEEVLAKVGLKAPAAVAGHHDRYRYHVTGDSNGFSEVWSRVCGLPAPQVAP